jgi:hypothetical protein
MSDEKLFSKKGQRQVSSFIGQELLYDYMTGQLDDERKKAVEDFARSNKDAQANIQKIQNGMSYADKLSQTQVSEALLTKVNMPSTYSQVLLQKIRFEEWSPALRLSLEALVVALGITVFALLIPWHKLMDLKVGSKDVVLTEVAKEGSTLAVSEPEATSKEDTFPDEGAPTPTTTTLKMAATAAVTDSTSTTSSTPTTTVTTTTMKVVKNSPPAEFSAATVSAGDEKRQGELWRGEIKVTNVPAITPKLVEKILELGGRKAGQVELGWSKNGDSSYFHFTMPENHFEELKNLFGEYGALKIKKEKHERVMPEGILRIIITVDEKK